MVLELPRLISVVQHIVGGGGGATGIVDDTGPPSHPRHRCHSSVACITRFTPSPFHPLLNCPLRRSPSSLICPLSIAPPTPSLLSLLRMSGFPHLPHFVVVSANGLTDTQCYLRGGHKNITLNSSLSQIQMRPPHPLHMPSLDLI
mmetsp:Transcript_13982/g.30362  ORF Transcript_13982/g.30362 Transcript_13982/m.30362 type:complete len:145 (-) Transcript_13982:286-720(-)